MLDAICELCADMVKMTKKEEERMKRENQSSSWLGSFEVEQ